MKTCTKCGEAKDLGCFSLRSDGSGRPRSACKTCESARAKALYVYHPRPLSTPEELVQRRRRRHRQYERAHKAAARGRMQKWIANQSKEALREASASRARSCAQKLTDGYVRAKLAEQSGVPRRFLPESLVEAKREHLRLVRLLKEKEE